jgi:hypothetical protein
MAESWRDSLPDDLKSEPMFADVPDVATLAKIARDTKALVGSSLRKPGPNATPEEKAEFLSRVAEAMPEIADMRKKLEESTAAQAKTAEELAAREKANQDAEVALRREWGIDYADKVKSAKAAAKAMGVPEGVLDSMPPAQVKVWAATAARVTGPGNEVGAQGAGGGNGRMTPAEAQREMAEIRSTLWDIKDPALAKIKAARLFELAKYATPA